MPRYSAAPLRTRPIFLYIFLLVLAFDSQSALALEPPVLIGPSGSINDSTPSFRWEPVTGASNYRLAIHRSPDNVDHYEEKTTATSHTLPAGSALAANTCYRWWVRAEGPGGAGPWSPVPNTVCYFPDALGTPNPIAPRGWVDDPTPEFQWTAASNAFGYELLVLYVEGGTAFYVATEGTRYTHSEALEAERCYYWQVRAQRTGEQSPWSKRFGGCVGSGPPRFEDQIYTNPIASMDPGELQTAENLHRDDFAAFAAAYYPRLGLPVQRAAFRGVWHYRAWWNGAWTVYDDNACTTFPCPPPKPTYAGHQGTDFWVSTYDYCEPGQSSCQAEPSYLVSPFPAGAHVWVEAISDQHPEGATQPPEGNTLKLVCYLDGVRRPGPDDWKKLTVDFFHLRQGSFRVQVGDKVQPGQLLAEIGVTGNTSRLGLHAHMELERYIDPFSGTVNQPDNPSGAARLSESLFWDQPAVERIANYRRPGQSSFFLQQNLRVDGRYHVTKREGLEETYKFSSAQPIEQLFIAEIPEGKLQPPVDLLTFLPAGSVRRSQETLRVDGQNYPVYVVTFEWSTLAPIPGEWELFAVDDRGVESNRVWIDFQPQVAPVLGAERRHRAPSARRTG